jgi:hypothetical protein
MRLTREGLGVCTCSNNPWNDEDLTSREVRQFLENLAVLHIRQIFACGSHFVLVPANQTCVK